MRILAFRPAPGRQVLAAERNPRANEAVEQARAAVMQAEEMPLGDAAFKEIVTKLALTVLRRLTKRGAAVNQGAARTHDGQARLRLNKYLLLRRWC